MCGACISMCIYGIFWGLFDIPIDLSDICMQNHPRPLRSHNQSHCTTEGATINKPLQKPIPTCDNLKENFNCVLPWTTMVSNEQKDYILKEHLRHEKIWNGVITCWYGFHMQFQWNGGQINKFIQWRQFTKIIPEIWCATYLQLWKKYTFNHKII